MMWLFLLACRTTASPSQGPSGPDTDTGTSATSESAVPSTADTADGTVSSTMDTVDTVDTAGGLPPYEGPALLSETELYADLASGTLAEDVIPYDLRYPLWTDGAEKHRYLYVPPGQTIDTSDPDNWRFPVGTVAFKEFVRDGVRVETRRFAKLSDDTWDYGTYLWRADGTDADFVGDGAVDDALGTPHDVPERFDCAMCHIGPADLFLGVSAFQLDAAQQAAMPLSSPVVAEVPGEGVVKEALGYLQGNCAHCHRDGTLPADRSGLELNLLVGDTDPQQVKAVTTGVGKEAKHVISGTDVVIVAGDPDSSQLWVRMGLRGLNGMPPAGTEDPDPIGVQAVGDWIRSLEP